MCAANGLDECWLLFLEADGHGDDVDILRNGPVDALQITNVSGLQTEKDRSTRNGLLTLTIVATCLRVATLFSSTRATYSLAFGHILTSSDTDAEPWPVSSQGGDAGLTKSLYCTGPNSARYS